MKWLRWEITFVYWLVPAPCSKQGQESRLSRTVFRWGFDISKNGDSMTSPGNLCKCSVTLTVPKGFFFNLNGIFCTTDGVHCLLSCQWAALRVWLYSSLPHMRNLYTLIRSYLSFFLFQLSQWLQYERCSNLLIPSVLPWTLVFSCQPCTGEPRTGPSAADRLHQCCGEVEIPFSFSWEADRMHKICENSQSSRKETKMMLAFSVAFSQKPSFILNTYKVLRNLEGCGVWNCVFQGQQELQTTA